MLVADSRGDGSLCLSLRSWSWHTGVQERPENVCATVSLCREQDYPGQELREHLCGILPLWSPGPKQRDWFPHSLELWLPSFHIGSEEMLVGWFFTRRIGEQRKLYSPKPPVNTLILFYWWKRETTQGPVNNICVTRCPSLVLQEELISFLGLFCFGLG